MNVPKELPKDMSFEDGYRYVLGHIIPPEATPIISKYLIDNRIYLKIVPKNKTFWGRFWRRGLVTKSGQKFSSCIELIEELRPHAALMTLLHEIAHHRCWVKYEKVGKKIRPHGKEWQAEFCRALASCVKYFPEQMRGDLGYLINHYSNKNENFITDYLQTWDGAKVLAKQAIEKWEAERVNKTE